ncbi:hypothetical protein P9684_03900 [Bacillus atrophaeus]|uniref:hypothetical protein n=1 Tax=Bacillus atrophaeus TaxID=1452 RepID=UPI002E22092B|nr:hypothetical protein [Bacillus atrophaeus]
MKTVTEYLVSISKSLPAIEENKQQLHNEIRNLYEELGKIDKELNEFYHKVEDSEFNVNGGFQLSLEGQKILRKRRNLKQEIQLMNTLIGSLNNNGWTLESLKIAEYKISKKKKSTLSMIQFNDVNPVHITIRVHIESI